METIVLATSVLCYIYIYQMLLSKATYSAFRLYSFFHQNVCFQGIEPTTFCTANAMLYHWATGTLTYVTVGSKIKQAYGHF